MSYKITDKCIGCTLCAKGCPVNAIDGKAKEQHKINPDKCIECGYCGRVCVRSAILDGQGFVTQKINKKLWHHPVIDKEICVGCSLCVTNCPNNCLVLTQPKFSGDINTYATLNDSENCIDCKICQQACPIDAIRFADQNFKTKGGKMYKAYCRVYQGVLKIGMNIIPWGMPETIEGPGSIKKLPDFIKQKGFNNILVVTDKVLNRELKMLDSLYESLDKAKLQYVVYDGVQPNPTDINIADGYKLFKENNCQAMIAFGGGSSMDCAKGIGAVACRPSKPVAKMRGLFRVHKRIPTIFAVPTTAGTGSETTVAAVITLSESKHKITINDPCLMPRYAVFDPELTAKLPPHVTSTTGLDALVHAVEAYTNNTYNTKLEKELSEKAVKLINENLLTCYKDGSNIEARQKMQKAAFYAGRAFTRGCVGYVHSIGHTLGGLYGLPHGLAMSIIQPYVLYQYGPKIYKYLSKLADVIDIKGKDDKEKSIKFIQWIEDLNQKMDIPKGVDCIKDEDVDKIIEWAMKEANPLYPVPVVWKKEDFKQLINAIRIN